MPFLEQQRSQQSLNSENPETKAAGAQSPDPNRFYSAVIEWLELNEEYKKINGSHRKKFKSSANSAEPEEGQAKSMEDMLASISRGEVGGLIVSEPSGADTVKSGQTRIIEQRMAALDQEISELKKAQDLIPLVRGQFRTDRNLSGVFKKVAEEINNLELYNEQLVRREFQLLKSSRKKIGAADRAALDEISKLRQALENRKLELETNPETSAAARLFEIFKYKEQLSRGRFAETPSRKQYLDQIRTLWEEGKNVFLTGPTGTGKTELFIYLGKKLYNGQSPEIIRGSERVGPAEIFGKSLLRATPSGATETYFQPGAYVRAIDKGVPLIYDEFNLLDTKTRFQNKELYNRKPGDKVTIQEDTGYVHEIQEGFKFGATANVKSEKYKERFELDPAESRVFEMRRIDYIPKEELYDLMLAKLIDQHMGMHLSQKDAGETLKQLCAASEMIQGAFLGTQASMYEDGGGATRRFANLEKAVLDPGRTLALLDGWPVAQAKGQPFLEYLNDHLRDFLNQEDFPAKDRKLLLKIFVTKGFFAGRKLAEFQIAGLKETELKAWGWKSDEEKAPEQTYLSPSEVAKLDPFGIRKGKIAAIGDEFLKSEAAQVSNAEKSAAFESAGFAQAREVLGTDFIDPEATVKLWGLELSEVEVPQIPFDRERLEKAKLLGEMLILRVDKDGQGNPLTMKQMLSMLEGAFQKAGDGKVLLNTDWYKDEEFFTSQAPQLRWVLVGKNILDDSTGKDYIAQTKLLRDYLEKNGLAGQADIDEASDKRLDEIRKIMKRNPKGTAPLLANLGINKNHRRTPVEVMYDLMATFSVNSKQRLLENRYDWTAALTSVGRLVDVGVFGSFGLGVYGYSPGNSRGDLGVCLCSS